MTSPLIDHEVALLASACLWAGEDEAEGDGTEALLSLARPDRRAGPVSESAVNKAIEEKVLTCRLEGGRRVIPDSAALYLACMHGLAASLKRPVKHDLFLWLDALRRDAAAGIDIAGRSFELGPLTRVRVEPEFWAWLGVLDAYAAGRDAYIRSDPAVMGGVPVITGTRIPVYSVLARIEGGDSLADLAADYPDLPEAAFAAAIAYARSHPRAGRPARFR